MKLMTETLLNQSCIGIRIKQLTKLTKSDCGFLTCCDFPVPRCGDVY